MVSEVKKRGFQPIDRLPQTVKVNNDFIEVWPSYCVYAKRNCSQCQLMGKLLCAPQHRAYATFSREQKIATAKEAKERGVVIVAKERLIPMFIVRAWVGAYCHKEGKVPSPKAEVVAPTLTMTEFDVGDCLICKGHLFSDSAWKPLYFDTQNGRVWVCGSCAEGIAKLFKALGITLKVKGVKDHA